MTVITLFILGFGEFRTAVQKACSILWNHYLSQQLFTWTTASSRFSFHALGHGNTNLWLASKNTTAIQPLLVTVRVCLHSHKNQWLNFGWQPCFPFSYVDIAPLLDVPLSIVKDHLLTIQTTAAEIQVQYSWFGLL